MSRFLTFVEQRQMWLYLLVLFIVVIAAEVRPSVAMRCPTRRARTYEREAYRLCVVPVSEEEARRREWCDECQVHISDCRKWNSPVAVVSKRTDEEQVVLQTFPLLNEVAPAIVLLSQDARFIVTIDNWCSLGWGDTVVVIYRQSGVVVQRFSLENLLTAEQVADMPILAGSRIWGHDPCIDNDQQALVLQPGKATLPSSPDDPLLSWEDFAPKCVDLETGKVQKCHPSSLPSP
jgi:hypothetical protein